MEIKSEKEKCFGQYNACSKECKKCLDNSACCRYNPYSKSGEDNVSREARTDKEPNYLWSLMLYRQSDI